jgi:hypothetical protein
VKNLIPVGDSEDKVETLLSKKLKNDFFIIVLA